MNIASGLDGIIRAFQKAKEVKPTPTVFGTWERPTFNEDDALSLKRFLELKAGKNLVELLRFNSASLDCHATTQSANLAHASGHACGYRQAIHDILTLSGQVAPVKSDHNESSESKVPASLEHLQP